MPSSPKPKPEDTASALVLSLGNAPNTPHRVGDPPIPGYYVPGVPTPVGGPGECSVEQAKALDGDPDFPVELVQVDAAAVDELRAQATEHLDAAREGVVDARSSTASGLELEHVRDELALIRTAPEA